MEVDDLRGVLRGEEREREEGAVGLELERERE